MQYKIEQWIRGVASHILLWLVSAVCLFPLAWMLATSFKRLDEVSTSVATFWPKEFQFQNYVIALQEAEFGKYFLNSVLYTSLTVLGVLLFASMAAFVFSKSVFPGSKSFFYLFIASMMIPIPGAFIPLYVLLIKLDLVNTPVGLILPYINSGLAFAIYLFKGFFDEIPNELLEAAELDGCSKWKVYRMIMVPLAKPILATVSIFTAMSIWNEYLLALVIVGGQKALYPLQVGIMKFQGVHLTNYPLLMAALVIATLPILVIYLLLQRFMIKGITAGAVKG